MTVFPQPDDMRAIEEVSELVAARFAQARELSERVEQVSVSAASPDGAVEVTMTSTGAMTDLRLDDAVRRWPAEQIAAEIMATLRDAQHALAARLAAAVAETVGAQTLTGQAVLAGLQRRFGVEGLVSRAER